MVSVKLAGVFRKLIMWLDGTLRWSLRPVILYGFGIKLPLLINEGPSIHLTANERRNIEIRQLLSADGALRRP